MLTKLTIKNIALIECAEIDFDRGLNVLSGETGAGKSVIIESINFVLGARADASIIRAGEKECFVSAEFDIAGKESIKNLFEEFDFDFEDTLIISRKLSVDKKNTIKINGNTVTTGMLKKFTEVLVDVHGQSEHFSLLSVAKQLSLIDSMGGDAFADGKNKVKEIYLRYKDVVSKLEEFGGSEAQRNIRLDVVNFQINEIEKAQLEDGEEEKLNDIKEKLKNQQKILSALSILKSSISDDSGVLDILSNSVHEINGISDISNDYFLLDERLNNVYAELNDICDVAGGLIEGFELSQYSLEEINSRLDLIKSLKRKYGSSFAEIMDFYSSICEEKKKLENFEQINEELLKEKANLSLMLYEEYNKLSDLRRKVSREFEQAIVGELRELGMSKAQFSVNFSDKPSVETCNYTSPNGFDEIEFLFSANAGEPLKKLSSVISGGEISRFMLSIKVLSSKVNDISTFIFDEIDAGISGIIARVVAEKLCKISRNVQVIAISHLPQIASFADNSLLIAKVEDENKTITTIKKLNDKEKVDEIIRLIGGSVDSSSIEHAKKLIYNADVYKNLIKG